MEKFIFVMLHALFGGAAAMLGGFVGYLLTVQFAGNHEFLPFAGFGIAAVISTIAYMRNFKSPRRRVIL